VGTPLERLTIDVLGLLPETDQGNLYIFVVMDYFSKWVEKLAMPEQSAATVAHLLVTEVICRFGVPLQIHTNQGRNFESVLFKEVCRLLDIEKTRTTPLHPQSDGMVERLNRTLEAMLSKFVQDNQRNWDQLLPLLTYRSAIHASTGCTPNELMFGRDVRLPVDVMFGSPPVPVTPPDSTDFAWNLREQVRKIHQLARDNLDTDRSDCMIRDLDQIPIRRERRCGCTILRARKAEAPSCKLHGRALGSYQPSYGRSLSNPEDPQGEAQVCTP